MADEQSMQATEAQTAEFSEAEPLIEEPVQSSEQFYRSKSNSAAEQKTSRFQQFKDFLVECKRVLLVTKKPDKEELKTIIKVSGLGILVIGLIGFLIHLAKSLLFK